MLCYEIYSVNIEQYCMIELRTQSMMLLTPPYLPPQCPVMLFTFN